MLKKYAYGALIMFFGFLSRAHGQDYHFALGVRLSNTSNKLLSNTISNSITGKVIFGEHNAWEAFLSYGGRFGLGALYEKHRSFSTPGLTWYYGAGAFLGSEKTATYLGPMGVVGLEYTFANAPINMSLDFKPELYIIDRIDFVPDVFGFSVRYVFK